MKFVVIDDDDGCPTMDAKEEVFELFGQYRTAKARAEKAALEMPGKTYIICEAIEYVRCKIGPPLGVKVSRRKPSA